MSYTTMSDIIVKVEKVEKLTNEFITDKSLTTSQTLNFIRSFIYDGFRWQYTAGIVNTNLKEYIYRKDRNTYDFFSNLQRSIKVKDGAGNEVDFPHICASLDGMLGGTTKDSWNTWAGDLATGERDANDYKNKYNVSAQQATDKVIGSEDYSCGMTDLRGDADAHALLLKIRNNNLLSKAIKAYFIDDKNYKYRFSNFIKNELGGQSNMRKTIENEMDSFVLMSVLAKFPESQIKNACVDKFIKILTSTTN